MFLVRTLSSVFDPDPTCVLHVLQKSPELECLGTRSVVGDFANSNGIRKQ